MLELVKPLKREKSVIRDTVGAAARNRELSRQFHYALDRAASLIHDVRNPLAAICVSAELLMAGNLDRAQTRRLASGLHAAANRMKQMFTEYSAAAASGETVEICNLREIILTACDGSGVMDRSDIGLSLNVPLLISLPVARVQMQSVFRNLIVNAMEAMPRGGAMRIAAAVQHGRALIEIEDTGPGVPEEIRDCLFEPFASAGKKDGLGLGLALSRRAVEDHGGEMWPEPEPGARFLISLPLGSSPGGDLAG